MSPRSFWLVVIKIAGIWLLMRSLTMIVQFFSTWTVMLAWESLNDVALDLFSITIVTAFFLFITWLLLFRSFRVLELLKLEADFGDELFHFNLHRATMLRIAVIVAGVMLFVNALPPLVSNVYTAFQIKQVGGHTAVSNTVNWIVVYGVKVFLGIFLIYKSRMLVNFIEFHTRKTYPGKNL
jgi:hypothetical protein